jgi:HK97 family phage prohead protease
MNHITLTAPIQFQSHGDGFFKGYASVFNVVDSQGDRLTQGSFNQSLKKHNDNQTMPKMLWQHDATAPIGKWTLIQEDDRGLYVEGQLLLEVERAREAYALIKEGGIDGLSIGFHIINGYKKGNTRVLTEVNLMEISLVTFAANPNARIMECKNLTSLNTINYEDQINRSLMVLNQCIESINSNNALFYFPT